jgi:general secretion pathway protein A
MYCEFYGFREKPFTITPNPRFLFLSKNHREAFAHLLYGIDNHAGFIKLTGEVGTGKTTVLRTLFEQLDERGHRTALIFNPCLTAEELMRSINREFAIPWEGLTITGLLDALNGFLLAENAAGRTVVLVIDEAQNLEPRVLEQIRLISNLETKTDKLIQIILAGQPELGVLLGRSELRQLSQRITVSYHLTPMDFEDSQAYVQHRLEVAGDWRAAVFAPGSLKQVFRFSGGVPRLINILCDRALLLGYVAECREISDRMVKAAIAEIRKEDRGAVGRPRRRKIAWSMAGAAAVLLLLLAATGHLSRFATTHKSTTFAAPVSPEFPALMAKELTGSSENESALAAFNVLMKLWAVPPVSGKLNLTSPRALESEAARRGLKLARYSGSLGLLTRMGYPAILEFNLSGVTGKRYLALTGTGQDKYFVSPAVAGRDFLTSPELESVWSGTAWLPWKNFSDITIQGAAGMKGRHAADLQQLLADTGDYKVSATGILDAESIAAVREFQAAHGIVPDGKVGTQTLLMLYRAGGKFPVPGLAGQEGSARK